MTVSDLRLHISHVPLLSMPRGPVFWVILVPFEYRIDVLNISLAVKLSCRIDLRAHPCTKHPTDWD
jgi:hypothetical protein